MYTNHRKREREGIKMREELLTRMIRIYGFEHEVVIEFARLMENGFPTADLEVIVKAHENYPFEKEE